MPAFFAYLAIVTGLRHNPRWECEFGVAETIRLIAWRTRRLEAAFSERVVALVRAAHPADLADAA